MTQTDRIRLDIPVLLPNVDDARDLCVQRLIASLSGRLGIAEVHVALDGPTQAPQLCIHYDPETISLQRVRELASSSGAGLTERFSHLVFQTTTQHARAARRLTDQVGAVEGVVEAQVAPTGLVRVEFDTSVIDEARLSAKLQALELLDRNSSSLPPPVVSAASPGDRVVGDLGAASTASPTHGGDRDGDHRGHAHSGQGDGHAHQHAGPLGEKSELIFALLAGLMVFIGWVLAWRSMAPEIVSRGFYIAAYLFGGYYTAKEALQNIRARRFEIDTLMLVAAAGAAALGEWAEGGLLLFLFSLGHSLEHYAMGRARKAIEALAELAPETALVKRADGSLEQVAVGLLAAGNIVLIKPNERLPADGFVVRGESSVNQAPVTGESVPVDKRPVDDPGAALIAFDKVAAPHKVFAGTINGPGSLEVMVARVASESTMARVVKLVAEAQTQRSPTQNFTDKFERIFVPVILLGVFLLLFAGLVVDEPFSVTFYRAMAVLVAASPCALAISVPSAVLSGVARAGRSGVLVKGGGPLENLGTLTAIAFDKTGTLTEGKPRLTDVAVASGSTEQELLTVALAVERQSDHPLASAVVEGAQKRLPVGSIEPLVESLKSIIGRGVEARIAGEAVHVGKAALFSEIEGVPMTPDVIRANEELIGQGRTTMIVRLGSRYLGVIGVMDTPRPAAAPVMRALKELGIKRLVMISGDNQRVAESVAKSVGLTEAQGDLMPEHKVDAIKVLREKEGRVAMVGDGVNDAPAMANATVGIAMGAAGSDVALETADVALMADDLSQLPFAVALSRRTTSVIRQNLWVSLGVVAVLIPATIFGLNIGTAVLFHEGSTLLVVVNALRLLAFPNVATASAEPNSAAAAS